MSKYFPKIKLLRENNSSRLLRMVFQARPSWWCVSFSLFVAVIINASDDSWVSVVGSKRAGTMGEAGWMRRYNTRCIEKVAAFIGPIHANKSLIIIHYICIGNKNWKHLARRCWMPAPQNYRQKTLLFSIQCQPSNIRQVSLPKRF